MKTQLGRKPPVYLYLKNSISTFAPDITEVLPKGSRGTLQGSTPLLTQGSSKL